MDEAFRQHSHAARRKNRSSTNLNHLTLAPLTPKLPISDQEDFFADPHTTYLQGKSAPTTPRLFSRSPGPRSCSHSRGASVSGPVGGGSSTRAGLAKSKSTTHLITMSCVPGTSGYGRRYPTSGTASPVSAHRSLDYHHRHSASERGGPHNNTNNNNNIKHQHHDADRDRSDADWLLRAGALIATETRESKGQAWLVSRQSSISLAGMRDPEDEAFERELARERDMIIYSSSAAATGTGAAPPSSHSQNPSRRASVVFFDGDYVMTGAGSSPPLSRYGSRSQSRTGMGANRLVLTPSADQQQQQQLNRRSVDGYFPPQPQPQQVPAGGGEGPEADDHIPGPDFVNLDERVAPAAGMVGSYYYDEQDTSVEDEAHVRRLVKKGNSGLGAWFGNVLGFRLFPVAENEDQEEEEDEEEENSDEEDDSEEDETDEGDGQEADNGGHGSAPGTSRAPGRRRKLGRSRRSANAWRRFEGASPAATEERMPPPKPDQGGWHDAAWLLTVASKVLL